jgi:phosphoribosylformylglycinamidine cyclo-ligase
MTSAGRYRAAGVDLDAAERAKRRIAQLVASTRTSLSHGPGGGFGGMVRVPADVERPVLVLSTDGVGTKALVAIRAGRHDTVGEDLVNHCVNDVLVHGARPLAFLDYIAGSRLSLDTTAALVQGVAAGCRAHDITLAGGETAQLSELYEPGQYDLAGTILGVVAEGDALLGDRVKEGDSLIGYASSGLHTNGYTLARRIVFDELGLDIDDEMPGMATTVGDVLLTVHRSYWGAVNPALGRVRALAHITGGGIPGNLVRALPEGLGAVVELGSWPVPQVFRMLQDAGRVEQEEMYRVFNMGIGLIGVVAPENGQSVQQAASHAGVQTFVIGEVVAGTGVEWAGAGRALTPDT